MGLPQRVRFGLPLGARCPIRVANTPVETSSLHPDHACFSFHKGNGTHLSDLERPHRVEIADLDLSLGLGAGVIRIGFRRQPPAEVGCEAAASLPSGAQDADLLQMGLDLVEDLLPDVGTRFTVVGFRFRGVVPVDAEVSLGTDASGVGASPAIYSSQRSCSAIRASSLLVTAASASALSLVKLARNFGGSPARPLPAADRFCLARL